MRSSRRRHPSNPSSIDIAALREFGQVLALYSPPDGRHVRRHVLMCAAVARSMGIPSRDIGTIREAALLHEFGRIGFRYDLRDQLVDFLASQGSLELLSRTHLITAGDVPEWPSPTQVVDALQSRLAGLRRRLKDEGDLSFHRFENRRRALGIRTDGQLPAEQRDNLGILFAHDTRLLDVIQEHRDDIPFDTARAISVLRIYIGQVLRKLSTGASDRDLRLAMIMMGADQLELTNNRERWSRSRRRPAHHCGPTDGSVWRSLSLTDEAEAGRDASLPSVWKYLVVRPADHRSRTVGAVVASEIVRLVCHYRQEPALLAIIEQAREAPLSDVELNQLDEYCRRTRWER